VIPNVPVAPHETPTTAENTLQQTTTSIVEYPAAERLESAAAAAMPPQQVETSTILDVPSAAGAPPHVTVNAAALSHEETSIVDTSHTTKTAADRLPHDEPTMVDDVAVVKDASAAAAPPPNETAILEDSTAPTMPVDVPAPAEIDVLLPAVNNYNGGAIDVIELSRNHVEPVSSNITAAVCYKTLFGDIDIGLVLQWVGTYKVRVLGK
jgi:hypothetical protein